LHDELYATMGANVQSIPIGRPDRRGLAALCPVDVLATIVRRGRDAHALLVHAFEPKGQSQEGAVRGGHAGPPMRARRALVASLATAHEAGRRGGDRDPSPRGPAAAPDRKIVAGRPVAFLWLSPDCKHFSKSKGGKPVDRKIRGLA